MTAHFTDIHAIVFDLDGTLYASDDYTASIRECAARYIAGVMGTSLTGAHEAMTGVRARFAVEGRAGTLSGICTELGGNAVGLHDCFVAHLEPEKFLQPDRRVVTMLATLRRSLSLNLYTNNNRVLSGRIAAILGLDGVFDRFFTIEDSWQPKPDPGMFGKIMNAIGQPPERVLFVGDRYEVDLRLPEQHCCPVYLSTTIDQLLRLENLLKPHEP